MDEKFMREAIKLAERAKKKGEVPIGAVVVLDGKVIGKGYNLRTKLQMATAHAEMRAIDRACPPAAQYGVAQLCRELWPEAFSDARR